MEKQTVHVPMAGMTVVENGTRVKTTLGSCVGLILHDKRNKRTALAHIMLPTRLRADESVGKYADTAIPALLDELSRRGSRREHLEAYLTGGAHLFGRSEDKKLARIGDLNLSATREILSRNGVAVVYEDTGGERGRVVLFDNQCAQIKVRTLEPPPFARSDQ